MKKTLPALILSLCMITASACSAGGESSTTVSLETAEETSAVSSMSGESDATGGIDLDLTEMNSNMVYANVYELVTSPQDHVGEKIRMKGQYCIAEDAEAGTLYHVCLITDALACCSQGIEFIPDDSYRYPDDYPEQQEEITVTGIFDTYYEGPDMYVTLRDAVFG
ncbi:MAG: hypothetical protein IKE53_04845 [Clostridiales bacterium]|nr:hypothetical protein [Clostridiales bacterium]